MVELVILVVLVTLGCILSGHTQIYLHTVNVFAFNKNHMILYIKHVYINNNCLFAGHCFASIDAMLKVLPWGKISP